MYYVTRQMWPDGRKVVEVATSMVMIGPDALEAKYEGEFLALDDPRDAAHIAWNIYQNWWEAEGVLLGGTINYGGGPGPEDELATTAAELIRWAEEELKGIPVCYWCREFIFGDVYEEKFCSRRCASTCWVEEGSEI